MTKDLDYYMSLPYKLVIIPDVEKGGYTAYYPELSGCVTRSETIDDLLHMVEDTKRVWLKNSLAYGTSIPEADPRFCADTNLNNPERNVTV